MDAKAALRILLVLALAAPIAQAQADPPMGKGKFLLYEDFEGVAAGQIPRGYQKTGAVGVVEDMGHGWRRSLRIEAATSGPRRITVKGDAITALGASTGACFTSRSSCPLPRPRPA